MNQSLNCYLINMRKHLSHNFLNFPGWSTKRHIVVIESDDWGSIRMPSKEVYQQFLDKGVRVDKDSYCKYDSLATAEDLDALFNVLTSVKDKNGNNAVLTADTIVANPVFEKIKESGFKEYFYEPFTETLKRSPLHKNAFELWEQGMSAGIFRPQLHGREHLNVKKWLRTLQSGEEITKLSFDLGTFGLTSSVDSRIKNNYMGAFNSGLEEDINQYDQILTEAQELFTKIFGYKSESFIATTYTWNPKIEESLKQNGVKYLQGLVSQHIPVDDDTTFRFKKNNYQGKKSEAGLTYLMRNAFFEPTHFRDKFDVVDACLERINIAFRWNKAAVISSHRLNFIGCIDPDNRDRNLTLLKTLLNKIVNRWPDVEFISSDYLGKMIENRERYDNK